jgi:hypothetical protein
LVAGDGLRDVYQDGKGVLTIRAKMHFEETAKKRSVIVITELPYQSSKVSRSGMYTCSILYSCCTSIWGGKLDVLVLQCTLD